MVCGPCRCVTRCRYNSSPAFRRWGEHGRIRRGVGILLGSAWSSLLSNLYLDPFDYLYYHQLLRRKNMRKSRTRLAREYARGPLHKEDAKKILAG